MLLWYNQINNFHQYIKMLFRTLGYILSFSNFAIIYGLTSNKIITNFWSPHWLIGIGSILFLSCFSIYLFYINNQDKGINVFKFYGGIYGVLSVGTYGYWGIKNLITPMSISEFAGSFALFTILFSISFLSIFNYIKRYKNTNLLHFISSTLSILTVGISLGTIYQYIFLQKRYNFDNFLFESIIISIGFILFVGLHNFITKNT